MNYYFRTINGLSFIEKFEPSTKLCDASEIINQKYFVIDSHLFPIIDDKPVNFDQEQTFESIGTNIYLIRARFTSKSKFMNLIQSFEIENHRSKQKIDEKLVSFMPTPEPDDKIPAKKEILYHIHVQNYLQDHPEVFEQVIQSARNQNEGDYKLLNDNKEKLLKWIYSES